MTEIVTGTPAVVGFTNGRDDRYGHQYQLGLTDKDQQFATNIDAGERTRDILSAIYTSSRAGELATEKIGAAGILAAEKIGAAEVLATEKIGSANQMATLLGFKDLSKELADCCCEIKKEVSDVKATVLAVDAGRIRDDLAQARAELLALRGAARS